MRLQYANLKVQLGWADRTLADVEYTYHKRFPYRRQSPVVPMLDAYVQQQQQRQRRAMASKSNKSKIQKSIKDTTDRGHRRRHKQKSQRKHTDRVDGNHDIGLSYADFWRSHLDHSRLESSPLGITIDEDAVLSHLGAQSQSQSHSQSHSQESQSKSDSPPEPKESTATTGLGLSNSMQEDLAQMIAVHNASRSQEEEEHDFHQFVSASPMLKTPAMASAPLTPPASSSPHTYNVPTTPKRQMVLPTTPPPSSSTKLTFTPSLPTPMATPTSVPQ